MFRARERTEPGRFTFHSSRMRMKKVTKKELEAMDRDSDRCALELSDAHVDVLGYACLVAIMSMGKGYHLAVARSDLDDFNCCSFERAHQMTPSLRSDASSAG